MEERKFKWFLLELANKRPKFKILDTLLCKGETLVSHYSVHKDGLFSLLSDQPTKIKHFLVNLIDRTSPIMHEFQPNRVIAISYHQRSIRILTPSSILEIPSQRVYSLKFRTIHLVPPDLHTLSLYKVRSDHQSSSVTCDFKRIFSNSKSYHDPNFNSIAFLLSSFVFKTTAKFLMSASFDVIVDSEGRCFLLKVKRMTLQRNPNHSRMFESSTAFSKSGGLLKSPLFLEMMRKTFDKKNIKSMGNEVDSLKDLLDNIDSKQFKTFNVEKDTAKLKGKNKGKLKLKDSCVFMSPGPYNRKLENRLGDKRIHKYRKDAILRKYNSALQTPMKTIFDK